MQPKAFDSRTVLGGDSGTEGLGFRVWGLGFGV